MRTPFTVGLVLLAILLGAGFAFDSGDKPARQAAPRPTPATPIATIERRVEQIRDLRFRDAAAPADGQPGPGQARRPRGPRPQLPRRPPPRRRGGAQAARAAAAGRRPPQGVGHDLRPGRGRLLRPAHQAPAGRQRRADHQPLPLRDHARPRAHARARGPALQARPGELELRRRRPRQPRAGRGLGHRGDVHLRRAPLHLGAVARRPALEPRAGHRRPAAVHRGAARLPLRPGPGVHQAALRRGRLGRGRRRLPLPPARLDRADHAPRQVPGASSSPTRSGSTRARAPAGAAWSAAPGASGRPAS